MEVTHATDLANHAIFGGKQAEAATMDDSPEFMHVLADTLYSDKPRATVREVLCNAWDIHIQSGKKGTAVEVTLDHEALVIKDHGPGIHPDMMAHIYLRYGNSTKKHDGKQTGGFGLGSKAPWSYADHFDVTSCHAGQKTIYKLSKSLPELNGAPGCVPIVQVPCGQETGLTVRIPLKPGDFSTFRDLVTTLAYEGQMNVLLNGNKLQTIPMEEAPHKWGMIQGLRGNNRGGTYVVCRYGNVIYPVPNQVDLEPYLKVISDFMDKLPGSTNWRLCLLADPNTISVTPSRESLSMSEVTVGSLKNMLADFCEQFNLLLKEECVKLYKKSIDKLVASKEVKTLWKFQTSIPGVSTYGRYEAVSKTVITEYSDIIEMFARSVFPTFPGFLKGMWGYQLQALQKYYQGTTIGNSLREFIREFNTKSEDKLKNGWGTRRNRWDYVRTDNNNWFHRHMLGKLLMRMKDSEDVLVDKLQVYGHQNVDHSYKSREVFPIRDAKNKKYFNLRSRPLMDQLLFLRRIVVICHRYTDCQYRIGEFPIMKTEFGDQDGIFYYQVPRSEKRVAGAIAFFEKQGFTIIDLTKHHPWEPKETIAEMAPIVKEKKAKLKPGIPTFFDAALKNGETRNISDEWWSKCERTETMETVIQQRQDGTPVTLAQFTSAQRYWIAQNWGTKIGVAVSTTQVEKYQTKGAMDFMQWLYAKMLTSFKTEHMKQNAFYYDQLLYFNLENQKSSARIARMKSLYQTFLQDAELAKEYHLNNKLTQEDIALIGLYRSLTNRYEFGRDDKTRLIVKAVGEWKIPFSVGSLIEKLNSSPRLAYLDLDVVGAQILDKDVPKERLYARNLLKQAMEG